MNGENVADILPGAKDATGAEILSVYSKISRTYAVYRTAERVAIQFADDADIGSAQRKAISPLNPLRGQINGLIDGWRAAENGDYVPKSHLFLRWRNYAADEVKSKAVAFDRRVADALATALQGDIDTALALLGDIKADIVEERTSAARVDYLAIAALVAALLVAISVVANWSGLCTAADAVSALWRGAAAGALGALFSTAIALRTRAIHTDLQLRENRTDAIARIGIGATAGALLVAMTNTGLVNVSIDGTAITAAGWLLGAFIGFIGGFSERLVPGLLDRASAAVASNAAAPRAGGTPPVRTSTPAAADERNPLGLPAGTATPPPAEEDGAHDAEGDIDGCVSDEPAGEDESTDDSQLPAAEGGTAMTPPAPVDAPPPGGEGGQPQEGGANP